MESAIASNTLGTKSVTPTLRNTHCFICGNPFKTERVGKLYCSAKCKQFGYNHKEKLNQAEKIAETGINPTPKTFYIDEFHLYEKRQKNVKRLKELTDKQTKWELAENNIRMAQETGFNVDQYTWNIYTSKKLTDNEEVEFYDLENKIELEFNNSTLKELSIEQWSFIKSLYPALSEISLCHIISSLSRDFIGQLNLSPININTNENVIIKNKYINHCNLIATGVINFEMRKI